MARSKLLNFVKNISYTLTANVANLLISAFTVLIIPKFIGVDAYGYYQLYLFYIPFVGTLYFGWCEGMYLRIGGKKYTDIDKSLYSKQFWLLGLLELLLYSIILITSSLFVSESNYFFVIVCICASALPICLTTFLSFILQSTYRIKEYSIVVVSEKILFLLFVISLMAVGCREYQIILAGNIIALLVSLCVGIFFCRDIVFCKQKFPTRLVFKEIFENMSAGIKLMLASLSSRLIIGIVRFSIQNNWDIATFGRISLSLNISNMVTVAINAIAVVIYPMLRRTEDEKLPTIYGVMRVMLMGLIFGGIILYYPAQKLLGLWLPQYVESLRYAAILLPICAYESKMSMLINTYYKTLRLENILMKCNVAALAVSVICSIFSVFFFESVTMAMISILVSLVFRGVLSEIILSHHIDINVRKDILLELAMTLAFIICNWYFGFAGMVAYAVCYIVYLIIKRQDIKETFNFIKSMG